MRTTRKVLRWQGPGRRVASLLVLLVWVTTTLAGPSALAATTTVSITSTLSPPAVTVAPGTTIQFVNNDSDRHRMRTTNSPAEFDSGNLEPGESFSVTLDVAGIYLYVDDRDDENTAYHGSITVSEVGGDDPSDPPPPPPPAPTSGDVSMAGRQFSPSSLTVAEGATVTFANDDDRDHTVTATDGSFDSGVKAPGTTFVRTFTSAGTYPYFCVIHPDMTGTVIVTGVGGEPPPPAAEEPPPPPPPAPVSGDVEIVDFAFGPSSLSVTAGSTVSWANNGAAPHTVTDRAGTFDSGFIDPGATYQRTFNEAGTYLYVCTLHPEMTGTVLVSTILGEAPPPPAEPVAPPTVTPVSGDVEIVDFAFGPSSISVPVGSTISWANNGAAPHTVTDKAGTFDSGIINSGATFRRTFSTAGTYNYFCTLHPQMEATLVVTDASGLAPPAEEPTNPDLAGPTPPGAIEMRDFSFGPSSMTVRAGSTVTWFNSGQAPHTATSTSFDSGLVQPGETFRTTVATPGTYNYICAIHPQMRAVLIVTDENGNAPPAESTATGGIAELLRQSAARRAILGAEGDDAPPLVEATMFEFGFDPDPLVTEVGGRVVWTNVGQAPHTVTDQAGAFDSDWIDPGGVWEYQFSEVGEYEIFCTIHPQMTATVKVIEKGPTEPATQESASEGLILASPVDVEGTPGPSAWHQTPMTAGGAAVLVAGLAALLGAGMWLVVSVARRG